MPTVESVTEDGYKVIASNEKTIIDALHLNKGVFPVEPNVGNVDEQKYVIQILTPEEKPFAVVAGIRDSTPFMAFNGKGAYQGDMFVSGIQFPDGNSISVTEPYNADSIRYKKFESKDGNLDPDKIKNYAAHQKDILAPIIDKRKVENHTIADNDVATNQTLSDCIKQCGVDPKTLQNMMATGEPSKYLVGGIKTPANDAIIRK